MLFPTLKHKKPDIIGGFISLIITLGVIGIFGILIYSVAESYVTIKVDKISDPVARAEELLNAIYSIIIIALGIMCLEKMRSMLTRSTDRPIFLRLPVSGGTIFRAKFAALLLWVYSSAFMIIIPINAIFYFALGLGTEFIIGTAIVYLLLPMVAFLIATLLILPYIYFINFISTRYLIMFITLTAAVVSAFWVYSEILEVIRGLFETSSVKFIFTATLIDFLRGALKFTYPANALAAIALGKDGKTPIMIAVPFALAALISSLVVTRLLYKLTLYRDKDRKAKKSMRRIIVKRGLTRALMHKEFITVFREPKYLFSYFTIALAMPFMVYCCYTLFDTLIFNALGLRLEFALALIVLLVFSILTNTFCATNITRDGKSALKAKAFPIKAGKLLFSKVLFCSIISSLSVIASVVTLYITAGLSPKNSAVSAGIGLIFSLSQIFIATRMDLNRAIVGASDQEVAKVSNKTIAKTITVGLFFSVIIGFLTLFVSFFAGASPDILGGFEIKAEYAYLFPVVIAVFYFLTGLLYYSRKIDKAFRRLTK